MKLSKLLSSLGISSGFQEAEVSDIVYDSRKVKPDCLFVYLRDSAYDGHRYAADAARAGACVIVAEEPVEAPGAQVLLTGDTKTALALLSAAFFGNPAERELKVIGITGTKGKTTTAYMVHSILESAGHKAGVMGTIGVLIGDEVTALVGVFTNFSEDHIGGVEHRDMQEYLESKAKLFSMCKTGVVNLDDDNVEGILKGHTCKVKTYGFGQAAQLRGADCRHLTSPGFLGIAFEVAGELAFTAEVGIPGRFNAYNALAAIACCHV